MCLSPAHCQIQAAVRPRSSGFQSEKLMALGLILSFFSSYYTGVQLMAFEQKRLLHGLSTQAMVVRLAQQAHTVGSSFDYFNSHVFMLRPPSRRPLNLVILSHLWLHRNVCFNPYRGAAETVACENLGRVNMQNEKSMLKPPWLCIPCYHSSTPQTNDVVFLLGRRGFRQNGAGCLATGYRRRSLNCTDVHSVLRYVSENLLLRSSVNKILLLDERGCLSAAQHQDWSDGTSARNHHAALKKIMIKSINKWLSEWWGSKGRKMSTRVQSK